MVYPGDFIDIAVETEATNEAKPQNEAPKSGDADKSTRLPKSDNFYEATSTD